ncbi:zn(II)2Cys6 transcription factor [Colletotrichum tofieldiae]|uniref:Zn(II)2Cys6 transcription factor n=1 Tax=Colletotrichum tofieldiae TaxID=708197 RepID=A0A166TD20_9PEZI|nr:Zn(II)2Cys6 transcription factor [Colletotrichum tofieldiae]GKT65506.1 Zn(II)2Cys6 transcription factor [Colletotrichum tofieldiae]GKT71305.1 zn(II)2Cys6 transcription factor [Colletotrichum tofieldiae]GKT93774.1 Zn(II)2Cys6 transcription factor [Colletotrichum tofieldiae]
MNGRDCVFVRPVPRSAVKGRSKVAVRSKIMGSGIPCPNPIPRKANIVVPTTATTTTTTAVARISPALSSVSRKSSVTTVASAGSPPDDASSDSSTESASSPPSKILESLNPYGSTLSRLDTVERNSLSRLLHKSNFMQYFIGPTFVDSMQLDMTVHLFSMFDQGKDAYIAMYSAFAATMGLETGEYDPEANLHRGAMAVEQLRSCPLPTLKREELLPWAGLGLGIVYFSNMALGTSAAPVRRYVLSHVRHLLGTAQISSTRTHYILVYMTAVDINECLMQRELPVCGIAPPEEGHVDAYVGVCMPLLQHLYELCRISYHLYHEVDVEEQTLALDVLEKAIEAWQPVIPPDFTNRFTTSEVIHMLAQSRIYKTAAMLFIHRLRYKFGEKDDMASAMSKSIISDLKMTLMVSKDTLRCVSFPYMLAAIEAKDAAEKETAVEAMKSLTDAFNTRYKTSMEAFLNAVWDQRDANPGMSWLDMMPNLPPISVGV